MLHGSRAQQAAVLLIINSWLGAAPKPTTRRSTAEVAASVSSERRQPRTRLNPTRAAICHARACRRPSYAQPTLLEATVCMTGICHLGFSPCARWHAVFDRQGSGLMLRAPRSPSNNLTAPPLSLLDRPNVIQTVSDAMMRMYRFTGGTCVLSTIHNHAARMASSWS